MEPAEVEEGFLAYANGLDIRSNPYEPAQWNGSWKAWAKGWCEGLLFDLEQKRTKGKP